MCLPGSGNLPNLVFEAESGVGGTVLTDAGASAGKYSRYDWSGSGWHSLAKLDDFRPGCDPITGV